MLTGGWRHATRRIEFGQLLSRWGSEGQNKGETVLCTATGVGWGGGGGVLQSRHAGEGLLRGLAGGWGASHLV